MRIATKLGFLFSAYFVMAAVTTLDADLEAALASSSEVHSLHEIMLTKVP